MWDYAINCVRCGSSQEAWTGLGLPGLQHFSIQCGTEDKLEAYLPWSYVCPHVIPKAFDREDLKLPGNKSVLPNQN